MFYIALITVPVIKMLDIDLEVDGKISKQTIPGFLGTQSLLKMWQK